MAADQDYCFTNTYEDVLASEQTTNDSIVFNLSILTQKAHHLQSTATMFFTNSQSQSMATSSSNSTSINIDHITNLLQEIIVIASNVMFTCQNHGPGVLNHTNLASSHENALAFDQLTQSNIIFDWSGGGTTTTSGGGGENSFGSVTCGTINNHSGLERKRFQVERERNMSSGSGSGSGPGPGLSPKSYDIIEVDAADLLAKYTHYCQVCGKGFKRDANLRMHMRAHGDEYKSTAALANPNPVDSTGGAMTKPARKYSCPQEGCRWNRKHVKFQPLKSMICMKNHYKRSHCPKMYSCRRCNQKKFSVLSDLRTHEKHCGDVKWRCSCGTTFSRKDKLMGHVGLFIGHAPVFETTSSITVNSH